MSIHRHHLTQRQDLPTGTVTLLFSDIENSTSLLKRWGCKPYAQLQERHHQLIQDAVAQHRGVPVDTMGDAEFIVFERAADALEGAVDAQRALEAHDWPTDGRVKVRIGLHTGEPLRLGDDYIGMAVYRAWRICTCGHGGQILISQEVLDAQGADLPEHLRLRDHGDVWLKQLDAPERLYQVLAEGLVDVEAAPVASTRLVRFGLYGLPKGRGARDVAELVNALEAAVIADEEEAHFTPGELAALASHRPADLREYRACRLAAWIRPAYQLDDCFVPLNLRLSEGQTSPGSGPPPLELPDSELFDLIGRPENAITVVTGPPGSGKSTLLRRLEFRLAAAGLQGEAPVPYFVPLGQFGAALPGALPAPAEWLDQRWRQRYGRLPPIADLLAEGRVVLILDGLDRLPHRQAADWRIKARLWKQFLHGQVVGTTNRAAVGSRALDKWLPLGTPDERVFHVEVQPLSDSQMQRFIAQYNPGLAGRLWRRVTGSELLDLLRRPFFLKIYLDALASGSDLPEDDDQTLSMFIQGALRRELENDNPRFLPGQLISERDYLRLAAGGSMVAGEAGPGPGRLTQLLGELAYGLSIRRLVGGDSRPCCAYDSACRMVGGSVGPAVIAGGAELGLLEEDRATGEVCFVHPHLQSYLATRRAAADLNSTGRPGTVHAAS